MAFSASSLRDNGMVTDFTPAPITLKFAGVKSRKHQLAIQLANFCDTGRADERLRAKTARICGGN